MRICLTLLLCLLVLVPGRAASGPPAVPTTGTAYFGFTLRHWESTNPVDGDVRPFGDRWIDMLANETGNKVPTLYAVPTIWQNAGGTPIPFSQLAWQFALMATRAPNAIPMITWNAQTGWGAGSPGYTGITTQTINSGSLDSYIADYADAVKAYDKPVFIRPICGEANGAWWRNCSPLANPALTKADYINAWIRIVNIFNARGVTNVAWLWNMVTFPVPPVYWNIDSDLQSFYPGDAYVTWTSVDHYDYGPATFLAPHVAFAIAKGKPLYVAEWGVRHPSTTLTVSGQKAWLGEMFDYFEANPVIKAVQYFNYNSSAGETPGSAHVWAVDCPLLCKVNYKVGANDQDYRLIAESGAGWRALFAARIANSRYY